MTVQQAVQFLKHLKTTPAYQKPDWIIASCPLARWTHTHKSDRLPSFGLSVYEDRHSYFNCFACRQGSAEELLGTLEMYAKGEPGYNFAAARELLTQEKLDISPLPDYQEFGSPGVPFEPWPAWWLDTFLPAWSTPAARQYLESRGVSEDSAVQFNLRFDTSRAMIVAPYSNVYGKFAGARGRSISNDTKGHERHFDYSWNGTNNSRLVWFNEPALDLPGPVVVVEGQFDCMRVALAFPKVVANLTAKPTSEKMRKLADARTLVQIPDNDAAGEQSVVKYREYALALGIRHLVAPLPAGVKDPDDCHPEFLRSHILQMLD